MAWGLLALLVLLVLVISAARRDTSLGPALPIAALVVVIVVAGLAWYQNRELTAAKHRIPPAEVGLADMSLQPIGRGPYELSGRIRNHSRRYTLNRLVLRVIVQDCGDEHCETVDQTDVSLDLNIPPGQARDFRRRVYFRSLMKPRGQHVPKYEILETRGS